MSGRRGRRSLLATRSAWALLAALAVAFLAFGSVHGNPDSPKARISSLDGIIKCPACEDLSIAQSNAPSAVTLRHEVARFVDEGWSDARVESWVTNRYGAAALLVPSSAGAGETLYLVPVGLVGLAVAGLGWYLWRRRPSAGARGTADGGSAA